MKKIGSRTFNHNYIVPANDEIKCVRFGVHYDGDYWKFAWLQFLTRKGVTSPTFSGSWHANEQQVLCVPDEASHFVGFYGHIDDTIKGLGLDIMKEATQQRVME